MPDDIYKPDHERAEGTGAMVVKDGVDFDSLDGEPVTVPDRSTEYRR